MTYYVGLDVSLKETHICVVDEKGAVAARGREATQPELLASAICRLAPGVELAVLETGGQSSWLEQELSKRDLNVVIVDARWAKKVLSCRINKTDANDAEGLAQLARTGWYRKVAAKSVETREIRARLLARGQLVKQRRDIENQVRGLLRGFGLRVGTASHGRFEARIWELVGTKTCLEEALEPLLSIHRLLCDRIRALETGLKAVATGSPVARRLMSVPGVGPMTALAFMTAIDDPHRFARSATVGAYLGLTSRRWQTGEVDWSGRISKQGDALARHMLYEAANSMLSRVRAWSSPKAWAARLVKKIGGKKARVALARKLAVILHRIWVDGTTFRPAREAAA